MGTVNLLNNPIGNESTTKPRYESLRNFMGHFIFSFVYEGLGLLWLYRNSKFCVKYAKDSCYGVVCIQKFKFVGCACLSNCIYDMYHKIRPLPSPTDLAVAAMDVDGNQSNNLGEPMVGRPQKSDGANKTGKGGLSLKEAWEELEKLQKMSNSELNELDNLLVEANMKVPGGGTNLRGGHSSGAIRDEKDNVVINMQPSKGGGGVGGANTSNYNSKVPSRTGNSTDTDPPGAVSVTGSNNPTRETDASSINTRLQTITGSGDGTYTDGVLSNDHLDRLTEHPRNNPEQRDGDETLQLQYISSEAVAARKDVNAGIAHGDHNSPLSHDRGNNNNNIIQVVIIVEIIHHVKIVYQMVKIDQKHQHKDEIVKPKLFLQQIYHIQK